MFKFDKVSKINKIRKYHVGKIRQYDYYIFQNQKEKHFLAPCISIILYKPLTWPIKTSFTSSLLRVFSASPVISALPAS